MDNIAFESALSLAHKIRHKEMSALELLEFYLQRVEKYNPMINAIIFLQRDIAYQRAKDVDALARSGVYVDDKARPNIDLERSHHVYMMLLRAATGVRVTDQEFLMYRENATKRASDDWCYSAYVDKAVTLHHREWWQLHNEREKMRLAWADFFQQYDLFLCPTAASVAFPHDHEGERSERTTPINGRREPTTDQLFWAGISGVVYLPSSVAPVGLASSGLPCGLQIVGAYMHDRTCIEFARLLEQELGGFRQPPGFN